MYYARHKLHITINTPSEFDENGDMIPGTGGESKEYLCPCFLHDVDTKIQQGYAGKGIDVTYYINMDRRNDLEIGQEVEIRELDDITVRGSGKIEDIKHTSGMPFGGVGNYTTIYI